MKPFVRDWMTSAPQTIGANQTVWTARQSLRAFSFRQLPVVDEGKLVGIVTERDVDFLESLRKHDLRSAPVREAMTPDPFTCEPDDPIEDVARGMVERSCSSAVVVDAGKVVGIFTAADVARALAEAMHALHPPA